MNRFLLFFLALICFAFPIQAQYSVTTSPHTYIQSFDALSNTGTANTWTDNTTMTGWYANRVVYIASDGTSNSGAMYSLGAAGLNERALGSVASGSVPDVYTAFRIQNNTSSPITSLVVEYTGEQWRNGGNAAAQVLDFEYQTSASAITNILNVDPWTKSTELRFTSPTIGASTAVLDGNAAANRTTIKATLTVDIPVGGEIMLRWHDTNDSGSDHALAIDDFSFSIGGGTATPIEGTGTATVINTTPSSPVLNTDIFRRSVSQNAQLTLTGSNAGTITNINALIPTEWTGLAANQVTLSGAGCSTAQASVISNTIQVTKAAVTVSNPCVIGVAALNVPAPTNANSGVFTFQIQTAGPTGTAKAIASSPKGYVTLPIGFLHDVDANGVALDNGSTVAVEGTITVASGVFSLSRLESAIEDATGAITLFSTGMNPSLSVGQTYIAKGSISQFGGLNELTPTASTFINLNAPVTVTPTSTTLASLLTTLEANESRLFKLTGATIDCSTWASGTVNLTQNGSSIPMLLDVDTNIGLNPCPASPTDVVGILGQADTTSPFTGDYQFKPRTIGDLLSGAVGLCTGSATDPKVEFASMYSINKETGSKTVQVKVVVKNTNPASPFTVDIGAAKSSTATNGVDVTGVTLPQTLTFAAGSTSPQILTFNMVDDGNNKEAIEYLQLQLSNATNTCLDTITPFGGNKSKHTLWIMDNDKPSTTLFQGQCGTTLLNSLSATFGDGSNDGLTYDGTARDTLYGVINYDGVKTCGVYEGQCITYAFNRKTGLPDPSTEVYQGGSGLNAEHIWPQSMGASTEPARSDLHNLRPANGNLNSVRSNYPYADLTDAQIDTWYKGTTSQTTIPSDPQNWSGFDTATLTFEPRDYAKGIVARSLAYFYTMYASGGANPTFWNSIQTIVKAWNTSFPVTIDEANQNILVAAYQNNKLNPFIIDPTLVNRAYFLPLTDDACKANPTANETQSVISDRFQLSEAYPNPFSASTQFVLTVPTTQHIRLNVYDLTGRVASTIFDGVIQANSPQTFTLNAQNLTNGLYFYQVAGEFFNTTKKMVVMK
jgi:hypothetical protein